MQPYADEFIFTEGSVAPFLISGAALGTVTDLEIVEPNVLLVETGVSTTALIGSDTLTPKSYYKWIIIYRTETGELSNPSQPITNYVNGEDNYTTQSYTHVPTGEVISCPIGFRNLPVSSDARVTNRLIYRTMANGEVYYFHSMLDNLTTIWYDALPDSYLGSETANFLNIPQTAEYISLHKERIILGNLTRIVKNWIMSPHSKQTTVDFDADVEGVTRAFTNLSSGCKGLQNCYAANTVGATLPEANYRYRFVFLDQSGLVSDIYDTNTVAVVSPNNSVVIPALPSMAGSNSSISFVYIYYSTDGITYYICYAYDPRRTEDGATFRTSGYTHESIPSTLTAGSFTQDSDTEKCGIAFSEIGQPATFILEDIRNIFPDDGDKITGLFDDRDGIIIWKEKSICKIFTGAGDPTNWNLVKLLPNIGCDEPNSLVKYGNDYVFSFQSSIYIWNSSSGLKEIGVEIWDSLALVTAYHCATADSGWYIFGVSGAGLTTGFGFLIYDYNVGTWYKFTTTSIPYVAKIKENGDDIGTFLTSNASYLLNYSENATDSDTGSTVQITPKLRTKTFGESIALLRLRKVKFNYLKLTGQDVVITIVNPESGITNTYTDSTGSGWKLYESPVKDTDLLKTTSKFYIQITGAGFLEFGTFRLEARPILRGKRELTNG